MKYLAFVGTILLGACFAFGAAVDGEWTATIPGMEGAEGMTIGYTFKAEGTTLTGTHKQPDGNKVPITNGKIDGNNISFTVKVNFGGQEMTIPHKGVVSGDQIKMTYESMGQNTEVLCKRVK